MTWNKLSEENIMATSKPAVVFVYVINASVAASTGME